MTGFDDAAMATTIWPELTTVRQPIAEMAQAAIDLLVIAARSRRAGVPAAPEHRVLIHTLVKRGSDASPH